MKEFVFEYKITADDYVTHQLFSASLSKMVKQHRKRGLILWTSAFFILALIFYFQSNAYLGIYFCLFGFIFIFIYPFYSRWIYKRYYKRYVYKNFKENNLNNIKLIFTKNDITISNGKEEGKVRISDIEKIYEISTHVFLKLNEGKNIIIPKHKIENRQSLIQELVLISEQNNIEYVKMINWKWK